MRSCSALDAAIASWRPCITLITCCRVKASFPSRPVTLCLVFLILGCFLENLGLFCRILGFSLVNMSKPWGFLMNLSRILKNLNELPQLSLNLLLPAVDRCFRSSPTVGAKCSGRLTQTPSCVSTSYTSRTPLLLFQRSLSPLWTPEKERQMGALTVVCTPTLKSVMAGNTVTLPVAEHRKVNVQINA